MLGIREDWGDMEIGVIMEEKKSLGVRVASGLAE